MLRFRISDKVCFCYAKKEYSPALRDYVPAGYGVLCFCCYALPGGGGAEYAADRDDRGGQSGAEHGAGGALGLAGGPDRLPEDDDCLQCPVPGDQGYLLAGGRICGLPGGACAAGGGAQRIERRGFLHAVSFRASGEKPEIRRMVPGGGRGRRAAFRPGLYGVPQRAVPCCRAVDHDCLRPGGGADFLPGGGEAGGRVSAEKEHAGPGKRTFPGAGHDPAGAVLHTCRGDNAVYDGFL